MLEVNVEVGAGTRRGCGADWAIARADVTGAAGLWELALAAMTCVIKSVKMVTTD